MDDLREYQINWPKMGAALLNTLTEEQARIMVYLATIDPAKNLPGNIDKFIEFTVAYIRKYPQQAEKLATRMAMDEEDLSDPDLEN